MSSAHEVGGRILSALPVSSVQSASCPTEDPMKLFDLLLWLCCRKPASADDSAPAPLASEIFRRVSGDAAGAKDMPAPPKIPEYLKTLKSGLVLLLQKTEPFLEGTPFQIPVSVINSFIELANLVSDNDQRFKNLFLEVLQHIDDVNDALKKTTSDEAKDRVHDFSERLQQEMGGIEALIQRRTFSKILESDEDTKTFETTVKRIDAQLSRFHRNVILAIEREVNRLKVDSALSDLYRAASYDAAYDAGETFSKPRCHPETRTDKLTTLCDWALGDGPETAICWLHGPAGAGKSAIAQSLCRMLADKGCLGGSFFFKRGDPSRGNHTKLFPTISHQLSCCSDGFKSAIGEHIRNNPAIIDKSLSAQLQSLIIDPSRVSPTVLTIIIDGLDECEGEDFQQEILRSIGRALQSNVPLRFLIVSRPEPHIEEVFGEEPSLQGHNNVNVEQAFHDVRVYLLDKFERIRESHRSMDQVCDPWPVEEDVEHIVEKSSGYFIYAATVIKFVDDKDFYPPEQLELIMDVAKAGPWINSSSPFAALDQLYTQILAGVPSRPELPRILSVIAAQLSLSTAKIGQLLQLDPVHIHLTLRRLHSVIKVPPEGDDEDDDTITVHHASFLDYLASSARSDRFHFSDTLRQSLACDMLRAASDETPDDRIVPDIGHVAW
ncbi:hypothetical protein DFH06DRAFT_1339185 [Mycena polygramma]|nr:hypothetical protein DFH06DRAFT_1339185 [Mycena polygramma]